MEKYVGLMVKFHVNRSLTDKEQEDQLKQEERLNVEPLDQMCVIKMNSTYLESVDKWFARKGTLSAWIVLGTAAFLAFAYWLPNDAQARVSGIGRVFWTLLIMSPVLGVVVWLSRKDAFGYTHYPIRFNRRTRMVHSFRTDGTVLSVPWDQVFFTLGSLPEFQEWDIRGHVLEPDNITVRETFALSFVGPLKKQIFDPVRDQYVGHELVRAHWEFIRRYMEDGPQAVSSQVRFCMPVDGRRESARASMKRVFARLADIPSVFHWIAYPPYLIQSGFRMLAMRLSKIPQWPKEIDIACAIEPDDPYAIEASNEGICVALFPEAAALAARIGFVAPPDKPGAEKQPDKPGAKKQPNKLAAKKQPDTRSKIRRQGLDRKLASQHKPAPTKKPGGALWDFVANVSIVAASIWGITVFLKRVALALMEGRYCNTESCIYWFDEPWSFFFEIIGTVLILALLVGMVIAGYSIIAEQHDAKNK